MAKKEKEEEVNTLETIISNIQKKYGKGSIITNFSQFPKVNWISSGSLSLDLALGGGFARGRLAEIFGPESVGKTTIALHTIAEAQKAGGTCAFIDMEHSIDMDYAVALGVDQSRLILSQPDSAEQALEIIDELTRSGEVTVIVLDSVAALVPQAEIEGDMGDQHMGLQARLMSQACRKLNSVAMKTDTLLLFLNQIRMKIGVLYGSPEVVSGGNALKFYTSQRLDIRRKDILGPDGAKYGNTTRFKVVKNKVAPPFRIAEVDIIYGTGIDKGMDLLRVGMEKGVIERGGAWFSYGDLSLGQGEKNAAATITNNTELYTAIREKIISLQDKKH